MLDHIIKVYDIKELAHQVEKILGLRYLRFKINKRGGGFTPKSKNVRYVKK